MKVDLEQSLIKKYTDSLDKELKFLSVMKQELKNVNVNIDMFEKKSALGKGADGIIYEVKFDSTHSILYGRPLVIKVTVFMLLTFQILYAYPGSEYEEKAKNEIEFSKLPPIPYVASILGTFKIKNLLATGWAKEAKNVFLDPDDNQNAVTGTKKICFFNFHQEHL